MRDLVQEQLMGVPRREYAKVFVKARKFAHNQPSRASTTHLMVLPSSSHKRNEGFDRRGEHNGFRLTRRHYRRVKKDHYERMSAPVREAAALVRKFERLKTHFMNNGWVLYRLPENTAVTAYKAFYADQSVHEDESWMFSKLQLAGCFTRPDGELPEDWREILILDDDTTISLFVVKYGMVEQRV